MIAQRGREYQHQADNDVYRSFLGRYEEHLDQRQKNLDALTKDLEAEMEAGGKSGVVQVIHSAREQLSKLEGEPVKKVGKPWMRSE